MPAVSMAATELPDPILATWLENTGSLTARLKALGGRFEVTLLAEGRTPAAEAGPGWRQGDALWHREVLLKLDGVAWVYALTEVPMATLAAGHIDFRRLGEQPLGEVLFTHPQMRRGPLVVHHYGGQSRPADVARQLGQPATLGLWGRGRQFFLAERPLRVNEVFLPAAQQALGAAK
ncbi:chorismate--pyruvate lyase family protein [Ferrimonas gelatinilytica]|uniref:Probable chorismate pyruvate-lyase n=1 Tax=Ferrimonas gelatinilytica TaxID=1255257 RepID=A0ABP9S8S1_9GAMM